MSNWRLQAQLKGMLEPEAEESPGYHSPDEGLEEDFRRLSLASDSPRGPVGEREPATPDRPRDIDSPARAPTADSIERRPDQVVRVGGQSVWIVRGQADTIEERAAELSEYLSDRFPQGRGLPELRYYTVWFLPNYRGSICLSGIHIGLDSSAYSGIAIANNRQFEGLRFRRVSSIVEGRRLFIREARRHGVNDRSADSFFLWE